MPKRSKAAIGERGPFAPIAATFDVGSHRIRVTKVAEGRWVLAVDGSESQGAFGSQADAWEAGVREADRLDRLPDPPLSPVVEPDVARQDPA